MPQIDLGPVEIVVIEPVIEPEQDVQEEESDASR